MSAFHEGAAEVAGRRLAEGVWTLANPLMAPGEWATRRLIRFCGEEVLPALRA
jgi:hypothetical protein